MTEPVFPRLVFMVMEGNPFDGLTFYGPFIDQDEADEYADLMSLEDWKVCPMQTADPVSEFTEVRVNGNCTPAHQ
jgi:hypothetical protein